MRFAYKFGRQLLAFEAAALFRVERARGDDADCRFILDLDVEREGRPKGFATQSRRGRNVVYPKLVPIPSSLERSGKPTKVSDGQRDLSRGKAPDGARRRELP